MSFIILDENKMPRTMKLKMQRQKPVVSRTVNFVHTWRSVTMRL